MTAIQIIASIYIILAEKIYAAQIIRHSNKN